MEMRNLLFENS